jgi:Helicase
MSSTVNGYEGTGRALSLKLIDQVSLRTSSLKVQFMLQATSAYSTLQDCDSRGLCKSRFGVVCRSVVNCDSEDRIRIV